MASSEWRIVIWRVGLLPDQKFSALRVGGQNWEGEDSAEMTANSEWFFLEGSAPALPLLIGASGDIVHGSVPTFTQDAL